jgi:HSP20 family protein
MALLRFDPFRDFDRLADDAWNKARMPVLPMDAFRRTNELVLQFDLPGVDPDTIDVTIEKSILSLTAERHSARSEGDEVVINERPTGRFTRQLMLGDGLDTERVHAAYEAGVLTLTLPVAEEVRPRRIQIETGTGAKAIDASVHEPGQAGPTVAA